ncbi:MAG: efflux RND transporter permease subunit, partial [Pseudomonadota bacterium]
LFGLILAIGIVVDDAIVVVENVERNIADGLPPAQAARVTMDEVSTAVIGTTLVLIGVFAPTIFVEGITGRFYEQFAVTISVATVISSINSLSLSPALAALLLRPKRDEGGVFAAVSRGFNAGFDALAGGYAAVVRALVSTTAMLAVSFLVFAGLLGGAWWMSQKVPTGFIPPMDQGYAIVVVQLPDGASLSRTDAVVQQASEIVNSVEGVRDAVAFAGFSGATFTVAPNQGVIFAAFEDFPERLAAGRPADVIIGELFGRLQAIREAFIIAIPPPSVRGVGSGGGFKLQLQDRESDDMSRVLRTAFAVMGAAQGEEAVTGVFTTFSNTSPQIFLEIDRVRAQMLNVPIGAIFEALSVNLGSTYVNDFNAFGNLYQVVAQADQTFRLEQEDIAGLKVRSATGALVPLGTLVAVRPAAGPILVQRYNMLVSVPLQGEAAQGFSTGQALATMEALTDQIAPPGVEYEWTELALQEKQSSGSTAAIFALSALFAFLVLAALYESWVLPLAIVLIVPTAILAALIGVDLRGMDNNVLTQVGLIVLVGLAAKNAILIVEFARQGQREGQGPVEAAIEACRLR